MRPAKNFIDVLGFFMEQPPGTPGGQDYNSAFCQLLAAAASAEAASIWNLDSSGNLRLAYGTNVDPMEADGFFLHQGEGISGAVAMTQKTIAVAQAFSNRQHSRRLDELIGYQTRSMISSPILYRGMLYGVVNILNYRFNKAFPTQWAERMTSLGILYAQALALAGKSVPSEPGEAHQNIKKNCVPGSHTTTVVGISPKIQNVLNLAFKAGRTDVPVLIYGETGTGKELTARRIHEANLKPKRPFSAINCAALTESILESELFGHVKGAFSGAVNHRKGKFAAASGGTLFLDEIGDMSLSCQAKILRAIQEKKVVPVGSEEEVDCDVRIIAATNQNLHYLVDQGKFREDLFYRLCGLEIHLPPLRERVEDIELLSIHFLKKISVTGYQSFSREALDRLKSFSWPGNVRQLQQAVLAAATVCEESIILPEHLPPWVCKTQDPRSSKDFHNSLPAPEMDQQRRMLGIEEQKERQRYLEALHKTRYSGTGRWNISAAARDLGVARKTLAYRIKKLGIPYS